ncbi:MAG: type I-C CRISPR-associated protein Cas5c [Candidatus Erginobacter occultus]|nr:type I-C CRISPR-associated protein Cas5c [Candidatus Erginobacter occultus]
MAYGIKLKVWGAYACFTRPEMKVERVTYDVITPSAARGILEAIYWKPEMRWVVDRLFVFNPIKLASIRRNEISCKIPAQKVKSALGGKEVKLGIAVEEHRQQRAAIILCDVSYGIEAHIEVLEHKGPESKPEAKHLDQFRRRAEKGKYFHHPYLGTREFPADFELVEDFPPCDETLKGERDLGYMLHDIVFVPDEKGQIIESNKGLRLTAQPRFHRFTMRDGIIKVPPLENGRVGK